MRRPAGLGTFSADELRVAGLHRASPSAALDKSRPVARFPFVFTSPVVYKRAARLSIRNLANSCGGRREPPNRTPKKGDGRGGVGWPVRRRGLPSNLLPDPMRRLSRCFIAYIPPGR